MKIPESPNSTAVASSDGATAAMAIGIPMPIMEMAVTRGAWSTAIGRGRPAWLSAVSKELSVTVSGLPKRDDIDANINEQLIVELYSK